jgi:two-component system, OmpR family, response regulator
MVSDGPSFRYPSHCDENAGGKGYSVQLAHTGPDGLKVAQQWRPDVVLLDIGLPGLDGYKVARRQQADKELVDLKMRLITLTGYAQDSDVASARDAGFDAQMVKAFEFAELEKLMALLKSEVQNAAP